MNTSFPTLSIAELVWNLICVCGLALSLANLMDAQESAQVAVRSQDDPLIKRIKRVVAGEHVWVESTFLLIHGLFSLLGFASALSLPAPDSATSSIADYISTAFFTVQIVMILVSWRVRRNRKFIIGLRLLAHSTSESSGTFDYQNTGPGEGEGTFDMKTSRGTGIPAEALAPAVTPPAAPPLALGEAGQDAK